jgi:hypothetical protein
MSTQDKIDRYTDILNFYPIDHPEVPKIKLQIEKLEKELGRDAKN